MTDARAPGTTARPPLVFFTAVAALVVAGLVPAPVLIPFPYGLAGVPLIAAALVLAVSERREMDRYAQSGLYTDIATALITTGVFRYSRNPLYLAMMLMVLGIAVLIGTLVSVLVVPVAVAVMSVWVIPAEERALETTFGEEYLRYRACVRRWL